MSADAFSLVRPREEYEDWIRRYLQVRYPELVPPFRTALDGYERIKANGQVDGASLKPIISAASSARSPLADTAVYFLIDLIPQFQEVCDAVAAMFEATLWHARFNALRCLSLETPRDFVLPLLRRALHDGSGRVRGMAARQIHLLGFPELIPEMEGQLHGEQNQWARSKIEYHLGLLRDGFCVVPQGAQQCYIWVTVEIGTLGRLVSRRDIDRKGIKRIVAEIRRNAATNASR